MIEPPVPDVELDDLRLDELPKRARQNRIPRRLVFDAVERLGKAVEIVDRLGPGHRGDRGLADVPVRRDRDDRSRLRDGGAERTPRLGVAIALDRIHWIAVTEEHRRHARGVHRKDLLRSLGRVVATVTRCIGTLFREHRQGQALGQKASDGRCRRGCEGSWRRCRDRGAPPAPRLGGPAAPASR